MSDPLTRPRALALLHVTVVIWGFTAILGKLITVNAIALVWYRQWLAALMLLPAIARSPSRLKIAPKEALRLFGIGALVAAHWACFYAAIKLASVAAAVVCLAAGSFFVALFEPLVFRRALRVSEVALGLFVIVGVVLLVGAHTEARPSAILIGIAAAAGSALFSTLNGWVMQRTTDTAVVSIYELTSGALWVTLAFAFIPGSFVAPQNMVASDWLWLLLLAGVCTALPWLWSLRILRTVSPFTLALSVNLEPVYSLILAWLIFPGSERLSATFYAGTAVLIAAVVVNQMSRPQDRP